MTTRSDTWFAVAVRDALDLWLCLEIKRSSRSDVYVFWPYPIEEQLHVSYHRDGHWWATCYGDKSGGRRHQQPDVMLSGIERVVTTPIHFSGVRGFDRPCRYARSRERYSGIFEMSRDEISAKRGQTHDISSDRHCRTWGDAVSPEFHPPRGLYGRRATYPRYVVGPDPGPEAAPRFLVELATQR